MRIQRLKIQNYKGFAEFETRLNSRFMLIVGDNGRGKTAMLNALSVAFGGFLLGIPSARTRSINRQDVRETVRDYSGSLDFIQTYPVIIEAEGTVDDVSGQSIKLSWSRSLHSASARTTSKQAGAIKAIARTKYDAIVRGDEVSLPLLCFYGTGRLWEEPNVSRRIQPPSRFDAYKNSHEARVSSAELLAWLQRERLLELESDRPSKRLSAWKAAVEHCFGEPVSISYSASRKRLEVEFEERREIVGYDNLSHGQRNILCMVGDIAFKAVTLNPHLGANAVSATTGIVLIDEIDLHLHPNWQRMIVPALQKSFPEIQFIATTHSPFIVQSLRDGSVLNLDSMDVDDQVYNLNLMEIIEEIQNVDMPDRSAEYRRQVNAATRFISLARDVDTDATTEKSASSDAEMERILERDIADPGLAALLKIERLAGRKD
jgi:predicted ATP-binding protein involved in virulence